MEISVLFGLLNKTLETFGGKFVGNKFGYLHAIQLAILQRAIRENFDQKRDGCVSSRITLRDRGISALQVFCSYLTAFASYRA